jgi:hypothetical protein
LPPERGTPEAVVHLVRLGRSRPIFEGRDLSGHLYSLATQLNEALSQDQRLSPEDSRVQHPYSDVSEPALIEGAVAAIGKYTADPRDEERSGNRQWGFISLERYFAWCRGMYHAARELEKHSHGVEVDPEITPTIDDPGERTVGALMHWLASLYVVIEGWEELKLHDPDIDAWIAEGGDEHTEGTMRYRLRRLRHGVFHYQREGGADPRFKDFWSDETEAGAWAIGLERAFDRFFRKTWEQQQANLDEWLRRP